MCIFNYLLKENEAVTVPFTPTGDSFKRSVKSAVKLSISPFSTGLRSSQENKHSPKKSSDSKSLSQTLNFIPDECFRFDSVRCKIISSFHSGLSVFLITLLLAIT